MQLSEISSSLFSQPDWQSLYAASLRPRWANGVLRRFCALASTSALASTTICLVLLFCVAAVCAAHLDMVLPEVSKDPPSPFLTVQSTCDGALLPVPPPPEQPCPSPGSDSSSRSWHTAQSCSSQTNGQAVGAPATQRTHLQSIVSQQSLNFNIPPDSPFEFEQALNSIAAASAVAESQNGKQHQAAAAAGHSDFTAQLSAHDPNGSQDAGSNRHKSLRFLGGSWLRPTQSVPHCAIAQKRQHPSALSQTAMPQLSFGHGAPLDKAYSQEPQPAHQQHILGKKLKTRVHKLLAWASGRAPATPEAMSPQLMSAPLGHFGSLTFTPTGAVSHQQQQQQGVPVAWQHQVFTEPSMQLINTTPGEQAGHTTRSQVI